MAGLISKVFKAKWLLLGIALVLLLVWILRPFLDVFVYGIFVYYITRPIKQWLSRYIKNEGILVSVSLLLLALPLIILIAYTLLVGMSQLMAVVNSYGLTAALPSGPLTNMTTSFSRLQSNVTSGNFTLESVTDITRQDWYQTISGYSGNLPLLQAIAFSTGSTIVDIAFKLFIIFLVGFYMLKEDTHMQRWFAGTFPKLMDEHNRLLPRYASAVDADLQKLFFGNLLSIVFFAIIAAVVFEGLSIFAPVPSLQIPSPILLGILCGAAALIPIVGMWLVAGPLFLYLLINSLIAGTLFTHFGYFLFMILAIFVFVLTIPSFVIQPFMARGQVHSGLLMFAYVLGPLVFGISGLFLGAIVLVLVTHYFGIVVPEMAAEGQESHDFDL